VTRTLSERGRENSPSFYLSPIERQSRRNVASIKQSDALPRYLLPPLSLPTPLCSFSPARARSVSLSPTHTHTYPQSYKRTPTHVQKTTTRYTHEREFITNITCTGINIYKAFSETDPHALEMWADIFVDHSPKKTKTERGRERQRKIANT